MSSSEPNLSAMKVSGIESDNQLNNSVTSVVNLCSSDSEVEFLYDSDGYSDPIDLVSDDNEEEPSSNVNTKQDTEQAITKDSIFELLQELRQKRSEDIIIIISEQLTWLKNCANANVQCNNSTIPDAKDVYYVSCALWFCQELVCSKDVLSLLTAETFEILLKWSLSLRCSSTLKRAIDRVLCSMYALRPEMYICLLEKLKIIIPASSVNATNNAPEMHYIFSHISCQNIFEPYEARRLHSSNYLTMSKEDFSTLATISHSYISSLQLINSGFLSLLVDVILDFCKQNVDIGIAVAGDYCTQNDEIEMAAAGEVISHTTVSRILLFFSELCWEGVIRTWLGSDEIRIFWKELLNILFRKHTLTESLQELMDATITFFSKCCWCYPKNTETLAFIIKEVFSKIGKDHFTGFVHQFFLQFVMATECIFVSVETDLPADIKTIWSINNNVPFPPPPEYPSWNKHQLLYLSTDYTCTEIISKAFGGNIKNKQPTSGAVASSSSKMDVDNSSSKKMKFTETEYAIPNLFLWIPNEARFINVDQKLTISQMLFILISSGDLLETPLIKFMVTQRRTNDDENLDAWYEHSFSLLHALVNIEAFVTIGNVLMPKVPNSAVPKHGSFPHSIMMKYMNGISLHGIPPNKNLLHTGIIHTHLQMETAEPKIKPFLAHSQNNQPSGLSENDSYLLQALNNPELPIPFETPHYKPKASAKVYTKPPKQIKSTVPQMTSAVGSALGWKLQNENNLLPWSAMPAHSLLVFGQFLKIPDFRLQVEKKSLLQSIMGLNATPTFDISANKALFVDDPKKLVNPLAVLPFEILRTCFKMGRRCLVWDKENIRSVALKQGFVDVALTYLAVFTHKTDTLQEDSFANAHAPLIMAIKQCEIAMRTEQVPVSKPPKKTYWPQGTGYSTDNEYDCLWPFGDSSTGINYQRRLQLEEEHITAVFHILATYINSDFRLYDLYQNYMDEICDLKLGDQPKLPEKFIDLIERSCLLTTLVEYLRNDSVLDILRHVPLYTAVMQLLRVMASSSQTVKFLITKNHTSSMGNEFTSLSELLQNMKIAADIYNTNFLTKKLDNTAPGPSTVADNLEEDGEALIADIQITAIIINIITHTFTEGVKSENLSAPPPILNPVSNEERYLQIMKNLRFKSYEIIAENENDLIFNVPYAFHTELRINENAISIPHRMKRLAQESASLSTTLPLTYSSSVFVRYDTNRLDIMKVLITGPADTPYMNGCFIFDIYFPLDYPNSPMKVLLETTGGKKVRFNPNLYECGKVCLSLLNTWSGRPEEKWNAQNSSLLQVLISIQALILVSDPYFNEPGYQSTRGSPQGAKASREYNSRLLPNTIYWAMSEQIRNPCPCFKEVIHTHFALKKEEIIQQVTKWINDETNQKVQASLEKQFRTLQSDLRKLPVP